MTSAAISRADFPYFARKLRDRSKELRDEIREVLLRSDSEQYVEIAGQVHDVEEEALADLLVDVNLAEIDSRIQESREIDAALKRIALGTYGSCAGCKEPIDRDRLEAYPTARRCLSCQNLHDQRLASPPVSSL